ncbi:MAG: hypothetical protein J7J87_02500 [Candidatus Diapherotrites archaeon]|nr:hypothetical protein [Candidatus Diapherotrites archaeon]
MLASFAVYILCFIVAVIAVKIIAKYNKMLGIVGVDINKSDQPKLPESAGIALLIPLWIVTLLEFWRTGNTSFLAWATMVSGFSIIGFADDTKHKFAARTLPWKLRAAFIATISILFAFFFFENNIIMVVLASLYLAGLASFENTFAGLNGWEIGSGFIISLFFALVLYGSPYFMLAVALNASILGLLVFNVYPAKVFPGDSGTLLIGSALAGLIIMTQNFSLMVVTFLFFIPHMLDFAIKIITNPKDLSQQKEKPYVLNNRNELEIPKSKKLDFAKFLILLFGPKKEFVLVAIIWAIVAFNCLLWYLLLL